MQFLGGVAATLLLSCFACLIYGLLWLQVTGLGFLSLIFFLIYKLQKPLTRPIQSGLQILDPYL